jgi:hypothetical protein
MRYLVGFVLVLALVASPLNASAQAGEVAAPSHEPAPEQPALQLQLDDAGVEVLPSPPRTPDGYTLEEADRRVRRARIGVGVSTFALSAGLAMVSAAAAGSLCFGEPCEEPSWVVPVLVPGVLLTTAGLAEVITSSIRLHHRKRARDGLRAMHYGTPRRVQWDLAQSRLVF